MKRGRPKKDVPQKDTHATDEVTVEQRRLLREEGYFIIDDNLKRIISVLDKKTKVYELGETKDANLLDLVRYGVHGMTLGEIKQKAGL